MVLLFVLYCLCFLLSFYCYVIVLLWTPACAVFTYAQQSPSQFHYLIALGWAPAVLVVMPTVCTLCTCHILLSFFLFFSPITIYLFLLSFLLPLLIIISSSTRTLPNLLISCAPYFLSRASDRRDARRIEYRNYLFYRVRKSLLSCSFLLLSAPSSAAYFHSTSSVIPLFPIHHYSGLYILSDSVLRTIAWVFPLCSLWPSLPSLPIFVSCCLLLSFHHLFHHYSTIIPTVSCHPNDPIHHPHSPSFIDDYCLWLLLLYYLMTQYWVYSAFSFYFLSLISLIQSTPSPLPSISYPLYPSLCSLFSHIPANPIISLFFYSSFIYLSSSLFISSIYL